MVNTWNSLRKYFFLSKKDMVILASIFFIAFLSSVAFLWTNEIYIERLHLTMQILAIIIFILLGLNFSFFTYNLISKKDTLVSKIRHLYSNGVLQKTISEIVVLNLLAIANFGFLTVSYIFDIHSVQIIIVSMSVASWPLFFLILMNMDGSLYSSKVCYNCTNEFGGIAVAENFGSAVVPADTSEVKHKTDNLKTWTT